MKREVKTLGDLYRLHDRLKAAFPRPLINGDRGQIYMLKGWRRVLDKIDKVEKELEDSDVPATIFYQIPVDFEMPPELIGLAK